MAAEAVLTSRLKDLHVQIPKLHVCETNGFQKQGPQRHSRKMVLRATHDRCEQVDRFRTLESGTGPAV